MLSMFAIVKGFLRVLLTTALMMLSRKKREKIATFLIKSAYCIAPMCEHEKLRHADRFFEFFE